MTGTVYAPIARRDVLAITATIAVDHPDVALLVRDRLQAACDLLGRRPGIGHVRDDLVPREAGVKFWPVGPYLIVYRASASGVQIARVLSAYRDIAAILARSLN